MTGVSLFFAPIRRRINVVHTPTLSHSTTRLQWPLEHFLWGLEHCSDHVTSSLDFRISNGSKIMAVARLEKIGHAFLKKRPPHLPFESYFSILKKCQILTFQKSCLESFW